MKVYVVHNVQIGAHVYRAGEEIDIPEEVYEARKTSFRDVKKNENPDDKELVNGDRSLTRDQLKEKLRELGVTFAENTKTDKLYELFQTFTKPLTSIK